jgi:hypothetical protein
MRLFRLQSRQFGAQQRSVFAQMRPFLGGVPQSQQVNTLLARRRIRFVFDIAAIPPKYL